MVDLYQVIIQRPGSPDLKKNVVVKHADIRGLMDEVSRVVEENIHTMTGGTSLLAGAGGRIMKVMWLEEIDMPASLAGLTGADSDIRARQEALVANAAATKAVKEFRENLAAGQGCKPSPYKYEG